MTTIDVIVPCYGYGRFLVQCVESVLSQTGPDLRVVIIDDASPDETAEVAERLARRDNRVTFIRHRVNRGHIATYNEGLSWIDAKYTLLLSADDWILPGALARAAAFLDANPTAGFVYGSAIELRDDDAFPALVPAASDSTLMSGEAFLWANRHCNPVVACTAVVRTAVQQQIGGYRPELPHAGDMEMWMRFAMRGPVGRLDANQGVYRRHDANMSRSYYSDMLLDLRQRKAAFDLLLEVSSAVVPNKEAIRKFLYRGLAECAITLSTAPLPENKDTQFVEMLAFAAMLDPKVKHTFAWKKQHIKRWLGPRLCAQLSSARRMARTLFSTA